MLQTCSTRTEAAFFSTSQIPLSAVGDASSAEDKNGLVGALPLLLSPPAAELETARVLGVDGGELAIMFLRGLNGSTSKSGACK